MTYINLSTGRRVCIDYDEDGGENPREWCHDSRLLIVPNRYFEGDETTTKDEMQREVKKAVRAGAHAFVVYAYVHSGVVLSLSPFGCRFDSGAAGVIIMPAGLSEQAARERAKSEIGALNKWLCGSIFCARVEHPDGFDAVIDDSICGLYADDEKEAAKQAADCLDLTAAERAEVLAAVEG